MPERRAAGGAGPVSGGKVFCFLSCGLTYHYRFFPNGVTQTEYRFFGLQYPTIGPVCLYLFFRAGVINPCCCYKTYSKVMVTFPTPNAVAKPDVSSMVPIRV